MSRSPRVPAAVVPAAVVISRAHARSGGPCAAWLPKEPAAFRAGGVRFVWEGDIAVPVETTRRRKR